MNQNKVTFDSEGVVIKNPNTDRQECRSERISKCIYLLNGLIQICKSPIKLSVVALVIAGLIFSLSYAKEYMLDISENQAVVIILVMIAELASSILSIDIVAEALFQLASQVFIHAIMLIITVIIIVPLMKLIIWFGHPLSAISIEDDIESAFRLADKDRHKRPILMFSPKKLRHGMATEYFFYSRWLSEEAWKKPEIQADLVKALLGKRIIKCECVGRLDRIVKIHVSNYQASVRKEEVLYDEDF